MEEVDLGENGWNLTAGLHGIWNWIEVGNPQRVPNYRVIPDPWESRDCIGVDCTTMLFRSPVFQLDDSGPLSVDIVGGQGAGGSIVDVDDS